MLCSSNNALDNNINNVWVLLVAFFSLEKNKCH